MNSTKKTYRRIFKLALALAFSGFVVFSVIYLHRASYYGKIQIELSAPVDKFKVKSTSPLGNQLKFNRQDSVLLYNHNRFYKDIHLRTSETNDVMFYLDDYIFKIRVNKTDNVIKLSELMAEHNITYTWHHKLGDYIILLMSMHWYFLAFILLILIAWIIKVHNKKIRNAVTGLASFFDPRHPLRRLFLPASILCLLLAIYSLTGHLDLSNNMITRNNPDQIEYHTCAVNQAHGQGILYAGKIIDDINYRMIISDKETKKKLEVFKGVQRLDRFPGYPVLLGFTYSIFGVNPVAGKVLNLFFLSLIIIIIPYFAWKIWPKNGYWAGLLASSLLFIYLEPYVSMLTPDLVSILFNVIIVYIYLMARRNNDPQRYTILAIISGISILFKASLMFFFVFMFIDIFFRSIKINKLFSASIIPLMVFLLCWAPYNIWSISRSQTSKQASTEILDFLNSPEVDIDSLNAHINKNNLKLLKKTKRICITEQDITIYKEEIKPAFYAHKCMSIQSMYKYNEAQRTLALFEYDTQNSDIYFMIRLFNNAGLLDINNEYNNDGSIHPEWTKHKNSFYNNDGLQHKSNLYRVLHFYYKHPAMIFTITHHKLVSYMGLNILFPCFILLFLLLKSFMLIATGQHYKKIHRVRNILLSIIYVSASILCFFCSALIPYVFIVAFFMMYHDRNLRYMLPLPVVFMIVSMLIFPVITYGNPRFSIYYDIYLFVITGLLLIHISRMAVKTMPYHFNFSKTGLKKLNINSLHLGRINDKKWLKK